MATLDNNPDCGSPNGLPGARLEALLRRSFVRLHSSLGGGTAPPCAIGFYPYANLKHTIRVRDGRILVRISDILRDAPLEILESVLAMLLSKLLRRPLPQVYRRGYRDYVEQASLRDDILRVRGERGRKRLSAEKGNHHQLNPLFAKLNRLYFGDRVRVRHLSWSPRKSRRVLGHYDPAHQAIILNRRLDHSKVPGFVVEFVLFHEMLHAFLGEVRCGGRNHFHHPAFREAERQFPDYHRAKAFIDRELC